MYDKWCFNIHNFSPGRSTRIAVPAAPRSSLQSGIRARHSARCRYAHQDGIQAEHCISVRARRVVASAGMRWEYYAHIVGGRCQPVSYQDVILLFVMITIFQLLLLIDLVVFTSTENKICYDAKLFLL